jgi:hypothetical protein
MDCQLLPVISVIFSFVASVNRQGCWNSSHMKLQMEDVVDALNEIHPDFVFYFYLIDRRAMQR